jgi:hypothetical protein
MKLKLLVITIHDSIEEAKNTIAREIEIITASRPPLRGLR